MLNCGLGKNNCWNDMMNENSSNVSCNSSRREPISRQNEQIKKKINLS